MRWKKPETEDAWEEYLSAYMDGELSQDEKLELENILKKNPDRMAQLESMKSTSNFLQDWKIDAPVPEASFIIDCRRQAKPEKGFTFMSWFRTLKLQQVLPSFLFGIISGILFMSYTGNNNEPALKHTDKSVYLADEYSISQNQANELFAETDAERLKVKVLEQLKKQNIPNALDTYKKLEAKYPESQAYKDLNRNRKLRFLLT